MVTGLNIREQHAAQKALLLLFSSVLFLGEQGFPLRGREHDGGALRKLVMRRAQEDCNPDVSAFLQKRDNWMSDTIQNEIISMCGEYIQRKLMNDAAASEFVGLVADGTTDISGEEQISVCLQYLNQHLEPENAFVGFYSAPSSTGETITNIVLDVLLRFGIPVSKLSGFSFDTAANMSGVHKGVQARLRERNPSAVYVPCSNHSLDLILQEASREVVLISNCLQFVKDTANTINESAKRNKAYKDTFLPGEEVYKLLGICATRWCVRAAAIRRLLMQYQHAREVLAKLREDKAIRGDTRAKIAGLALKAEDAATYVALSLVLAIYEPCEMVAASLQSPKITAQGVQTHLSLLKSRLERLREGALVAETEDATAKAEALGLASPRTKRHTRTPGKVRHDGKISDDIAPHPMESVRCEALEALDLVLSQLEERFCTTGLQLAARRERALLTGLDRSAQFCPQDEDLELPPSISPDRLQCQMAVLAQSFEERPGSPAEVLGKLKSLDETSRKMFKDVMRLVTLVTSVPTTVASAERSFSMLRRLKTYLRTRISQRRLTNLALLNVYPGLVAAQELAQVFAGKNAERMKVFGRM